MLSVEAGEIIGEHAEDCLVVVTMSTIFAFPNSDGNELTIRCAPLMGGASSIGLGLALAQPDRKVLVLDGDGSLLMQLGSLATIAGAKVDNLYHFVFHNRHLYEGGGRVQLPSPDADFAAMAVAAGYRSSVRLSAAAELAERVGTILQEPGPTLIELSIDLPDGPGWSNDNPQGEVPDWWFTQMREDALQVSSALGVRSAAS